MAEKLSKDLIIYPIAAYHAQLMSDKHKIAYGECYDIICTALEDYRKK